MADAIGQLPRIDARDCRAWVSQHCDGEVVAAAYERPTGPWRARRRQDARACLSASSASWTEARSSSATASAMSAPARAASTASSPRTRASYRAGCCASDDTPLELLESPSERTLRRPVLPDAHGRARRSGAVLDRPPPARRPRLDGGGHSDQPPPRDKPLRVVLEVDTDFADLFEVKDGVVAERDVSFTHDGARLTLAYEHGPFRRSVTIASQLARSGHPSGLRATTLELGPGEQWSTTLHDLPPCRAAGSRLRSASRGARSRAARRQDGRTREVAGACAGPASRRPGAPAHLSGEPQRPRRAPDAPRPRRGRDAARGRPAVVHGAVRSRQPDHELPSAALPPGLAATTLRVLAARQATERDDFHEQEPGKILHELRFGELTARGERPHSPYFGSADATPLFLVLLDEYHRWTGDDALVRPWSPTPAPH